MRPCKAEGLSLTARGTLTGWTAAVGRCGLAGHRFRDTAEGAR